MIIHNGNLLAQDFGKGMVIDMYRLIFIDDELVACLTSKPKTYYNEIILRVDE